MKLDSSTYRLTDRGKFGTVALIVAVVGIIASVAGYFTDSRQFFFSYLTAFMFWTSLALGGLFFTMLHHMVAAKWSVVLRRLAENIMTVLPAMAVLFVPLLFGLHDLYHWTHEDAVATDQLLQGKSGYLNTPFFVIRLVGYFVIWFVLTRLLYRVSIGQDAGHTPETTRKMRVISAPGIILFAITITFASFDWLMSLDAHWYSTIFGVYIFAGSLLAMLSFMTLVAIILEKKGVLKGLVSVEHLHDLGKLMFAFCIFWGYMAFSQYFLIWYGNIPEETVWFLHRWESSWRTVTMLIVYGHFVAPFLVLFPQFTKRSRTVMAFIAVWIMFMHWVDLYWIVMPSLHAHSVHLSWIDAATMVGVGGIFLWLFWRNVGSSPVVPAGDPALETSMRFVNS